MSTHKYLNNYESNFLQSQNVLSTTHNQWAGLGWLHTNEMNVMSYILNKR